MQVNVEEVSKLKRKMSVEIPLSEVKAAYDKVYAEIRSNVRVNGFRPGKYPRDLAEKRFRTLMAQEAIQNLVPQYFDRALKEKELRPATQPTFQNLDVDKTKPLKFDVEFEIVPPFELVDIKEFKLEDKAVEVSAKDLDERIENLRKSRSTMVDKGSEAAATGDVVTVDFVGTRNGEAFDGGTAAGQRIELGSGQYLSDFEKGVEGIVAGKDKTFDVTFPADYGAEDLKGQTVQFKATAHKVEKKVPAELNAEFFKQFGGAETEAAFREHVEKQAKEEKERSILADQEQDLAKQIRTKYGFDVPEAAVSQGLEQFVHDLGHREPEVAQDEAKLEERKTKAREDIVGDLRLSYVLDEVGRKNSIQVDPESVRQRFFMQAYMMGRDPSELVNSELGERLLSRIERSLTSEKVLHYMVTQVLGKPWVDPLPQGAAQGHDHDHDHDHGHDHDHDHHHGHNH
ncbi:MAG TPA: trigger factor [bacterium]